MKQGKEFESLIAKIYRELNPVSKVILNDKILGLDSNNEREIDVSIRSNISGHDILIVVQARDRKAKVNINAVGEFAAVVRDVRANKGILVSRFGFTKGAIDLAQNYGIDLCTAHDANSRNWKADLKIPILFTTYFDDFDLDFGFIATEEYSEVMKKRTIPLPQKFNFKFTIDKGRNEIIPLEEFKIMWKNGKLITNGEKQIIDLFQPNMELIVEPGLYIPITHLKIIYSMRRTTYLKYFEPHEFRGIENLTTGKFAASHFKIESHPFTIEKNNFGCSPFTIDDTWTIVTDPGKLAVETIVIKILHLPQIKPTSPTNVKYIGNLNDENFSDILRKLSGTLPDA